MGIANLQRPLEGHLRVRLPWGGHPSANYLLLAELIGTRTQVEWDREEKAFAVARRHFTTLRRELPARFPRGVVFTEFRSTETCVQPCWDANPDTAELCECGCAGFNHGTGLPWSGVVVDGYLGAVSIKNGRGWRRYDWGLT